MILVIIVTAIMILATLIQIYTNIRYADLYTQKVWYLNNLASVLFICLTAYLAYLLIITKGI